MQQKPKTIKIPNYKPVVSYWKSGDPCYKIDLLRASITEITVIRTKRITDDLIKLILENKDKIFLHLYLTGLNKTPFEPKIPDVGSTFFQLKKLIDSGFSQKQLLVVVDPILPNYNGIKVLELILRLFTEFKELRLRFIRFHVLTYTITDDDKYLPGNKTIASRREIHQLSKFLIRIEDFWKDYYKLLDKYKAIISVDTGEEALIGVRELMALGFRNEWKDNGVSKKIIEYENGNKYKPIVKIISGRPIRCQNRCVLCPFYG